MRCSPRSARSRRTSRGRGRRTAAGISLLLIALNAACSDDRRSEGDRFVATGPGAVKDHRTGFVWTRRDSERDLTYEDAESYCDSLRLDGSGDWRLPRIDQLRSLYDEGSKQPCGDFECRVDPALELDGPYFWSSTPGTGSPSRRFYFDFQFGTSLAPRVVPRIRRRVLCARE